jgi:hypothetical protein
MNPPNATRARWRQKAVRSAALQITLLVIINTPLALLLTYDDRLSIYEKVGWSTAVTAPFGLAGGVAVVYSIVKDGWAVFWEEKGYDISGKSR